VKAGYLAFLADPMWFCGLRFAPPPVKKNGKGEVFMRTTWLGAAIIIILIAAGSYGLYLYLKPAQLPEHVLYGNGHVEATDVKIAAEVSGKIIENRLAEGEKVEKGALLVRVDDEDLQLQKARLEAEIAALQQESERTGRELQVWQHHLKTAEQDYARNKGLEERGSASPKWVEDAENSLHEAQGRVDELQAEIGVTGKRIAALRSEYDLIAHQIDKTLISAPKAATILAKAVEAGEYVKPGQIVAVLADLTKMELRVFIPERDLAKVKLGTPARIRVDAYPEQLFQAHVGRIDQEAQFTPRDIHMPEERVRLVFGVTLLIENPESILKPGMPADAWILSEPGADWPDRLFVPD
tara:strand:- start:1443 stop:2504 length:1062 start_codon:yes stop_codon:yes gene_type:complete